MRSDHIIKLVRPTWRHEARPHHKTIQTYMVLRGQIAPYLDLHGGGSIKSLYKLVRSAFLSHTLFLLLQMSVMGVQQMASRIIPVQAHLHCITRKLNIGTRGKYEFSMKDGFPVY